jgi:hypothetical protein
VLLCCGWYGKVWNGWHKTHLNTHTNISIHFGLVNQNWGSNIKFLGISRPALGQSPIQWMLWTHSWYRISHSRWDHKIPTLKMWGQKSWLNDQHSSSIVRKVRLKCWPAYRLLQCFSNFFQLGTTFISQNVLRTTLLLSPLKANLSFF